MTGSELKTYRQNLGRSRMGFARELGISRVYLMQVEENRKIAGKGFAARITLHRIAGLLEGRPSTMATQVRAMCLSELNIRRTTDGQEKAANA